MRSRSLFQPLIEPILFRSWLALSLVLGTTWGILGVSWRGLGPFFLRARSCRSLVERLCIAKLPKVPERSARPAGFHWGFTMVLLGFPWPKHFQNLCPKHSENPRKNPPQHLPKSMPKPPKIEPKTLQNRGLEGVR